MCVLSYYDPLQPFETIAQKLAIENSFKRTERSQYIEKLKEKRDKE